MVLNQLVVHCLANGNQLWFRVKDSWTDQETKSITRFKVNG